MATSLDIKKQVSWSTVIKLSMTCMEMDYRVRLKNIEKSRKEIENISCNSRAEEKEEVIDLRKVVERKIV
jgi:hypothetical protein